MTVGSEAGSANVVGGVICEGGGLESITEGVRRIPYRVIVCRVCAVLSPGAAGAQHQYVRGSPCGQADRLEPEQAGA